MRKYIASILLAVALATAALVPLVHAGSRPASSELSPDRVFAADVIARHRAGWRLADIAVDYETGEEEEDMGSATMSILLARGEQAERFSLRFGDYGAVPVGYTRVTEAAPSERRVYRNEPELFSVLASGGSLRLSEECGVPFVAGSRASVALYDGDWYVVTASETGRAAQEKLASLLASSLGAGMDLTRVESIDEDGTSVIEMTLVGDETLTLRSTVDEGGEIVSLEARRSPGSYAWSRIRGAGKLVRALRDGASIRAMVMKGDDPKLILSLDSHKRVLIRLEDVEQLDDTEEEGCGC